MSKVHCIINLTSGDGAIGSQPACTKKIRHFFPDCTIEFTSNEPQKSAIELTHQLLTKKIGDPPETLIVMGGDGTIGEVVHGIFTSRSSQSDFVPPKLGIVNLGSGGDFARNLDIPRDLSKSLAIVKDGQEKQIDVGRLQYIDFHDKQRERYFINVASVGLSARIADRANQKQFKGHFPYFFSSFVENLNAKNIRLKISTKDQDIISECMLIAICNGKYFGQGMQIAPFARINDGLFDLTYFSNWNRLLAPLYLKRLYQGTIYRSSSVSTLRTDEVHISEYTEATKSQNATTLVWVECDGEMIGRLPVTAKILKKALTILV